MSKFSEFLKTLGGNLKQDYTSGIMGKTGLPGSGSYSQYMMKTPYVGDTGEDQGIRSSRLLEAMQAMLVNGYNAAVNEAKEGEDSQLKKLAKQIKV